MNVAIVKSRMEIHDFTYRWIEYCNQRNWQYEILDISINFSYTELSYYDIVLWHVSHANYFDKNYALNILTALKFSGTKVFPDPKDLWHFDNKISQFFLLSSLRARTPDSEVFFSLKDALSFSLNASYPFVFKLKGGASSSNVKLVSNKFRAIWLSLQSFTLGFRAFNRRGLFVDSFKRFLNGRLGFRQVLIDFVKIFIRSKYEFLSGREKGYFYIQKFIEGNASDIRVIVVNSKAFAIKRHVRVGDFRASGSGLIDYDPETIDLRCVEIAFDISMRSGFTCMGYDFVMNTNGDPIILEISYGFAPLAYRCCPGYWDVNLKWNPGEFYPEDWMIEGLL
jgi:glutathione synthase/RimK-type ligase-like ATP-grasp enzyme